MNIDFEGEVQAAVQVDHQIVGGGEMTDDTVRLDDAAILEDENLGTVDEVLLLNAQEIEIIQEGGDDR